MPRPRQPARLWLRPATTDRKAVWIILDGGKQHSTGYGADDREQAERFFTEWQGERFLKTPEKHREASKVTVAEVIAHYLIAKESTVKRPKELAARAEALLAFWGDKTLDDITTKTCREYWQSRSSRHLARRELEDLRAACRLAIADNLTRHAVTVTLPPKPRGRVNHLERDAVALLVWSAYRRREVQKGVATKKRPMRHVARFIIAALYTGSRSSRVWQASFVREKGRPFIDLDAGVYYRAWEGEDVPDKKRAPPIRVPGRLLAHMRRWRRMGATYLCEYQGRPADPKRAFRTLANEVLGEDGAAVVRHTMRHTAATWLMQAGTDMWESAGFLGMTKETLETVYGHHHPDHQSGVSEAFTSGRAGRKK